jgi:hypothetical protein
VLARPRGRKGKGGEEKKKRKEKEKEGKRKGKGKKKGEKKRKKEKKREGKIGKMILEKSGELLGEIGKGFCWVFFSVFRASAHSSGRW